MFGGGIVGSPTELPHGVALQDTDKVALFISSLYFSSCLRGIAYSFPMHHKNQKMYFPPQIWKNEQKAMPFYDGPCAQRCPASAR